jgi:hypothetical protein
MKKPMKKPLWLFGALLFGALFEPAAAQPVGNVRGTVIDAASEVALPYVTVIVLDTDPTIGVITDERGAFSLPPLPVGRYNIQASFLGYEPTTVREVMVGSAREIVLEISMTESTQALDEVVVIGRTNKQAPINPMALAGARMLSVEEASRYAGGLDDPARQATAFAGTAANGAGNSIAIRGNSPQSMQWKLEGVEIPNPNHFPEITGVGGGVLTAFSAQVLGNSDFYTGAFPAQYSNALSGVFDMQLRNGNNQQYEHTAQVGSLGVEFASEGPFKKGGQGSYLFNYRYATLALMADVLGGDMEETSGVRYQDLSFKINLPTRRAGTFSLWGIGSIDRMTETATAEEIETDEYIPYNSRGRQWMGAAGLSHRIFFSDNTYLKTSLAATYARNDLLSDSYNYDEERMEQILDMQDKNTTLTFDTYLNTKFNARHTNRTGVTMTGLFYDDNYNMAPGAPYLPTGPVENYVDMDGNSQTATAFSQSTYQFNKRLTGELGVNVSYFALNEQVTVEPRASLRWKLAPRHTLALAGGLHSRRERLDYYLVSPPGSDGKPVNKNLDLSKAYHVTMSYDWNISDDLHLRVEPYYQYLYDVPVIPGTGRSIINQTDFWLKEPLVNHGKGRNFGLDLTLERYLRNGFYYMINGSVFDSRYRGDDGVWHDTRYNRRYLANALGGKEWTLGRHRQQILGINLRLNAMGGSRYTPLDEAASLAAQSPVEDESRLMEGQYPDVFTVHLTVNWQIHRPKVTHETGLKILNLNGSKDYYGFDYNRVHHRMDQVTNTMSIPNIYYRISF